MSGCEAGGGRRAGRQRLLGGGVAASIDAPPRGGGSSNQLAVAMSSDSIVSVVEVRDTALLLGVARRGTLTLPLFSLIGVWFFFWAVRVLGYSWRPSCATRGREGLGVGGGVGVDGTSCRWRQTRLGVANALVLVRWAADPAAVGQRG